MSDEWTLVMETSVPEATLVLAHGDEIKAEADFYSERSQEVDLYQPLQEVLTYLPEREKLSAVVIGTGPGSYNGARVGIASAQAIAQVHDCDVAGLCSFEGVGKSDGWAVGDARRGSFFYLKIEDGRIQGEPVLLAETEFQEWITLANGPFITFEEPARLKAEVVIEKRASTAAALLESWRARSESERAVLLQKEVAAFYLRPPHITKSKKGR